MVSLTKTGVRPSHSGPSKQLRAIQSERARIEQLLADTRAQSPEIQRIAAELEAERISNNFGMKLATSLSRRPKAT